MKSINLFQVKNPIILFAMLMLFVSPVWAQSVELSEEQRAQMTQQIELTKERLELSDEQAVAVEEILRNTMTERLLVMEKHGIKPGDTNGQRPDMSTMRKMRDDMERLDSDTQKQLKNHLSKGQMKTWKKIEKERRNRMRSQMMGRG